MVVASIINHCHWRWDGEMGPQDPKKQSQISGENKNPREKSRHQEGAQSIKRAVAVLKVVASADEKGIRLSKIAKKLELPVSTIHRILSTLSEECLLSYNPSTKLYNLGLELYAIGLKAQQNVTIDQYRNVLKKVADETEDTAYLIIRSGNDSLCIERIEGSYPIKVLTLEPGARRPLGIGGAGLALLAALAPDQAETVIESNSGRYGAFNRTAEDIGTLVRKAVKAGYAISDGAMHMEMRAVGVPIFNSRNELVCAISVGAIRSRLPLKRCEEVARLIKAETDQLI